MSSRNPDDIRAEYSALVDYHGSLVNSRFTIAGLYVAGAGFVASVVLGESVSWERRIIGSVLAWWLTMCLWVLELRSRALLANLAVRGIEIERKDWGLRGTDWYLGFFSRQHKLPPQSDAEAVDVPAQPELDRPRLAWMRSPLPLRWSRYISHSWGLDLLYAGSLIFWTAVITVSVLRVLG